MYSRKIKKTRRLTGEGEKKYICKGKGSGQCGQSLLKDGVVKCEGGGRRQGKKKPGYVLYARNSKFSLYGSGRASSEKEISIQVIL
ncbi:MAG: hypothetical protein D3911_16300 [Candidatus Electrothrix sp. AW3_4]|nr:hypothetical protein [Candidatus Electrothrix gigas]